jgi:hypothetical protein
VRSLTSKWEIGNESAPLPRGTGVCTESLAVIYRKDRPLTPVRKNFIQALKQPVEVAH